VQPNAACLQLSGFNIASGAATKAWHTKRALQYSKLTWRCRSCCHECQGSQRRKSHPALRPPPLRASHTSGWWPTVGKSWDVQQSGFEGGKGLCALTWELVDLLVVKKRFTARQDER